MGKFTCLGKQKGKIIFDMKFDMKLRNV